MSAETSAERSLEYFVLDVFSKRQLEGNALAVVMNPGILTNDAMQAIARETNLSETVFVERRDAAIERVEGVLTRIFTTEEELPFAGHPTLGTASLLRNVAPECVMDDTVKLALKVGAVPVRFARQAEGAWPLSGEMTQRDPEFGEVLDKREVAALTGLEASDFDARMPIQIVSTGTAFAIVPLASADALARLNVRQEEAGKYLRARGARWFYVLGPTGVHDAQEAAERSQRPATAGQPQWRARMQFNGGEDPATGSAAGCAISFLVYHGAVRTGESIHVRQGVEMLRPSDLFLSAKLLDEGSQRGPARQVTDVRVGGSTVLVAKGHLFLP